MCTSMQVCVCACVCVHTSLYQLKIDSVAVLEKQEVNNNVNAHQKACLNRLRHIHTLAYHIIIKIMKYVCIDF